MKIISTLLVLLFPFQLWAVDCVIHKNYCQIIKNRPGIDREYAMRLSNLIYEASKKYDVPSHIYNAILAQESLYRPKTTNCVKGVREVNDIRTYRGFGRVHTKFIVTKVCRDLGISQIFYKTAQAFDLDMKRLVYDLEYSIDSGAMILGYTKKLHGHKKYWWSYYHSYDRILREKYIKLVSRFL